MRAFCLSNHFEVSFSFDVFNGKKLSTLFESKSHHKNIFHLSRSVLSVEYISESVCTNMIHNNTNYIQIQENIYLEVLLKEYSYNGFEKVSKAFIKS